MSRIVITYQMVAQHAEWLADPAKGKRLQVADGRIVGHDFQKNNLSHAEFLGVVFENCSFRYANLAEAYLEECDWIDTELNGVNMSRAMLHEADLSGQVMRYANLSGADLSRASLKGCELHGANMSLSYLDHASLDGAALTGATLRGAYLRHASMWHTVLDQTVGILAMGPLGSRHDRLIAYQCPPLDGDGNMQLEEAYVLRLKTGCFDGTADEFGQAVTGRYPNSKIGRTYLVALALARTWAEGQ